jgi:hypothetical protein
MLENHSSKKSTAEDRLPVDRGLAFKLSMFNTLGLALAITSPMIIDRKMTTDYYFQDTRHYSWALLLLLFLCPLVFFLTYRLIDKSRASRRNLWVPLLPLGVLGAMIGGFAFRPQIPHDGALLLVFGYGLVSFSSVVLRHARDTGDYLDNTELDFNLRLERLKATITFWQQFTVYGVTAYLAAVISAIYIIWSVAERTVKDPSEQVLLGAAGLAEIILLSVCVVVGPLNEALAMTLQSIERLTTVRVENNKT